MLRGASGAWRALVVWDAEGVYMRVFIALRGEREGGTSVLLEVSSMALLDSWDRGTMQVELQSVVYSMNRLGRQWFQG